MASSANAFTSPLLGAVKAPEIIKKGTMDFDAELHEGDFPKFVRSYSGASTEVPGTPFGQDGYGFSRCLSDTSVYEGLPKTRTQSSMVPEDPEDAMVDEDGMTWMRTSGQGALIQREAYYMRLAGLEASLEEVKELYAKKSGKTVDDVDEDDMMDEEHFVDADGMPWTVTHGQGIDTQRELYEKRLDALNSSVQEVKSLYEARYNKSVDDDTEEFVDQDGMRWICTVGQGPEVQKRAYDDRLETVEDSLAQVKALWREKYGCDFDSDSGSSADDDEMACVDADGTAWLETAGEGAQAQREAYAARLDGLGRSLSDVKALYKAKYGEDVDDDEEHFVDADGTPWTIMHGQGIEVQRELYEKRLDALDASVQEVRGLYQARYNKSVDDDTEEYWDQDGMRWTCIVGQGPEPQKRAYDDRVETMEDSLAQVKALWRKKYGRDFDSDSEAGADDDEMAGADGDRTGRRDTAAGEGAQAPGTAPQGDFWADWNTCTMV